MSVAYQHVHSDVPPPAAAGDRHTAGAGRTDRGGNPARPSRTSAGRIGVPRRAGRCPVPTGPAQGAGARAAPPPRRVAGSERHAAPPPVHGPGGTRVPRRGPRPAPAPFTPANRPPAPARRQSHDTVTRRPVGRRATTQRAGAAVADRDPGDPAAGDQRGGRWLVARRPLGGNTRCSRPHPAAGRGTDPGRRAGPKGQHRSPEHGARRGGRRVPSRTPAPGSCAGPRWTCWSPAGGPRYRRSRAGIDPAAATAAVKAADLTAVVGADKALRRHRSSRRCRPHRPRRPAPPCRSAAGSPWCCPAGPAPGDRSPTSPASPRRTPRTSCTVAGFALGPRQRTFDPVAEPGSVLGSTPGGRHDSVQGQRGLAARSPTR